MKSFMDQDFLLQTKTASDLFHSYAEKTPVLDYHCHINPAEIADNRKFDNITQVWLGGDHYKWRFMRSCGVDEKFITGRVCRQSDRQPALPLDAPGTAAVFWLHGCPQQKDCRGSVESLQ